MNADGRAGRRPVRNRPAVAQHLPTDLDNHIAELVAKAPRLDTATRDRLAAIIYRGHAA